MSDQKTDILIIGGGIAGCIAAISLVDCYHVTVIDKLSEPKDRIGESLAPAAGRILKELDLLEGMENYLPPIFLPNLGMQSYWGSDQLHVVDHLRNPDGFVKSIDRKSFEMYLRKVAEERGVNCIWGSTLHTSFFKDSRWNIQIKSNIENAQLQKFSSAFVIDASGRQSHFARSLGIKRLIKDKLLACWITLSNTQENTMSTISAVANGWWYSSVVPNRLRVVAYHTDSDLIDKSELKNMESFLKLAKGNEKITDILKGNEHTTEFKGTVAANSTKLEQVSGNKWAALGDAAISFDPLSSQGMFNAMASAMQLRTLILQFGFTEQLSKSYTKQIDQIWQHYIKHRSLFYQAENRWKTSEFWKRRHHN